MAADLAQRLLDGEREAVAEALNLADDRRPDQRARAIALLDRLEREEPFPGAMRIGITGAPGTGKSSLLGALVRKLRSRGETLAIVAVDPSSRRSGGALLGDRIRVRSGAADPGVFIRSMAARERLGGLADATRSSVVILSAVFERVFVETVGVGQSEVDVAALVDTLVYVGAPESGDTLQFMKAGILELPDIFVVNKADLGAPALRTAGDLEAGLRLGEGGDSGWTRPVLLTSARDGTGIDELIDAMDAHRQQQRESGELRERRLAGREAYVVEALERRHGSYGIERLGGARTVHDRVRSEASASVFALVSQLEREIEACFREPP